MKDFLALDNRLNDWGPQGRREGEVLVFAIGNPNEGHGPALPRDNDLRCAQFVASRACERTGARFVAMIPYATDRVGDIARHWSPAYLPWDVCAEKSSEFVRAHCRWLRDTGARFSRVVIVNGHGGNQGIDQHPAWAKVQTEFAIGPIAFAFSIQEDLGPAIAMLEPLSPETRDAYRAVKSGHADTLEHSVAMLYHGLDLGKLTGLNRRLTMQGTDAALREYPPIGGLAGYLKFGDARFDPLRAIPSLVECWRQFEADGQILLYPELARAVMDRSIQAVVQTIGAPVGS